MTKKIIYMIDFLCQIKILLKNMLKITGFLFKNPGFLLKFHKFQVFFCLNCQSPGKVATL